MLLRRIKDLILKRPLCFSLAGFLLVYFLCGFFQSDLKLAFSIIGFYITLVIVSVKIILKFSQSKRDLKILPSVMIIFAISLALLLSFTNFDKRLKNLYEKYDGLESEVTLSVLSSDTISDYYSTHEVIVTEIGKEKCHIKATMISEYFNPFDSGDTISLPVKISVTEIPSDLSQAYSLSHGFLLELTSSDEQAITVVEDENIFPYSQIILIRQEISNIIGRFTKDEGRSLSRALIYGDRSYLPYSLTSAFRELGISHMLAISGMHFSVIIGIFALIFLKLRINKRFSVFLLAFFVFLYTFIAGFSGSVCRAAIMLIFSYIPLFFGRRSDAVTSLFCSVFIICMFSPYAIYDIGLLLSFSATLGILTVSLPVNEGLRGKGICKIKPIYWIISSLNITLSAILFTLPISYFCFGYISYISPISNLIFSVFIILILYLAPALIVFSPIAPISKIIGSVISLLAKATFKLAETFADLGEYCIPLRNRFCALLFILLIIALILMPVFIKNFSKRRALIYIPLTVFIIGCYITNLIIIGPYMKGHSVCYYTEGDNDAIILSSGGESILCDISSGSYNFTLSAMEYAESSAKTPIKAYMITDYHYTHIATVTKLVTYSEINTFILPIPVEGDREFHDPIVDFLKRSDCEIRFYTPNEDTLEFGKFNISPSVYTQKIANPASLILIESEDIDIPSYAYFSNVRDLYVSNREFASFLTSAAISSDYTVCGSHGDSSLALYMLKDHIKGECLTESFFSGIKN